MRLGLQVQSAGVVGGLEVMEVFADLAAAKAGLLQGDIILKVNGEQIDDPEALVDVVFATPADRPLNLTIRRGEEERVVEVRLS